MRQPLSRAVLLVPDDLRDAVEEIGELLADELNVDELEFAEDASELVRVTVRPDYRTAGPDFGSRVRDLAKALEALDPEAVANLAATLESGVEVDIDLGDGTLRMGPEHADIRREPAEGTAFAYEPPFGISLDLEVTPELRREGLVREFVHQLQIVRRDLGLDVTDRIELQVAGPDELLEAVREHEDYLTEEVLATTVGVGSVAGDARVVNVDGSQAHVVLKKSE